MSQKRQSVSAANRKLLTLIREVIFPVEWIELIEEEEIKISMDGRGRAIDNIFIERFWRSVKWDYVYIKVPFGGLELYQGLK